MKKAVVILLSSILLLSGCGKMKPEKVRGRFDAEDFQSKKSEAAFSEIQKPSSAEALSKIQASSSEVSELNADTDYIYTVKAINVIWGNSYPYAFGSDYVYIDSDGKIYFEGEMEEPLWCPSGACDETYTGKQFTEDELNEFLSIDIDDEDQQVKVLSKMGLSFGRSRFPH